MLFDKAYVLTIKRAAAKLVVVREHLRSVGIEAETFLGMDGLVTGLETSHPYEIDAPGSNYRIGGNNTAALERMLQSCRANGIKPILLAPPVTAPHRQVYTPAIEAAFGDYVHALCQHYGCTYVDFRAQVPDALFSDNHHLLPEAGGRYFSRRLTEEVLVPAWLPPQP